MTLTILSVAYPLAPVSPDASGGAEQVLATLDRALVAAGHRSLVLAQAGSRVAGQLIPVEPARAPFDDVAVAAAQERHREALARVLAREPVDLVHLHGIDFPAYLPAPGPPVLATLHLPPAWYPDAALRPARPRTWVHCVSEAQHRDCPASPALLPPIANGIDVAAFAGTRRRGGFALVLGRICPEKGVHLAIEAARRAGVPLVIAGIVFPYEAHRRYFADEIAPRLGPACRFVGPVGARAKRRLLASARCLLVPSLAPETSSLVAREAAASGTPAIVFAAGALPEAVEEGRTGFVVAGVDGMARAIGRAAAIDPDLCRAVARGRFDEGPMIARYVELYGRLASGSFEGRHPETGPPWSTHLVGDDAALDALEPEWWDLWRRCPAATPFGSPAWAIPWWRAFRPGALAAVAVRAGGRLVALAPSFVEDGEYGRRLLPIGIGITDYLDVLVDPDAAAEAGRLLAAGALAAAGGGCWSLEDLPPFAAALALPPGSGTSEEMAEQAACPVLDLPAHEDALCVVPARQRRKIRMAQHRTARRDGVVEAVGPDGMTEFLADLVALHRSRWETRGEGGVLADARVRAFHADAMPLLARAGLVRASRLRVAGRTVAAHYGLASPGRAYAYLGGFDPDFAFESPGTILLADAIERAGREGAREFHLLRGQEPYKYAWGASDRMSRRRVIRSAPA